MIPCIIQHQKDFQGIEGEQQRSQESFKGDFIANLRKAVEEMALRNTDSSKCVLSFFLSDAGDLGLMTYLRPSLKKRGFQAKGRLVAKSNYPFFFLGVFFLTLDRCSEPTCAAMLDLLQD